MPTVTLNKTVLEKLIGKKLPLDKLKERISYLGTDLEGIEGNEIYVEIFPKRPDLLSEQGFGRAFASFIGVPGKTGLTKYTIKKSGYKVIVDKSVLMRPYTVCAIAKGLTFNDERIREVMQIQEKLATTHGRNRKKSAYGLYPLKNINFPITYIAKDPHDVMFKPLGFTKKIRASHIEELHPKGKEYKHITQGWKKYPFFIDAQNNVMCMLPYTNSNDTGKVDESTREIFIECTGVNWENVNFALNILITTLADMGGEIYSLEIVYPDKTVTTPNLAPKKMKISRDYVNQRLGMNLSEAEIKKYLARMGHDYNTTAKTVYYPAYRADILHPVDMIEDIAIAYGYENFKAILPKVATTGHENSIEKYKKKIVYLLVGLGYLECNTYHLINSEDVKNMYEKYRETQGTATKHENEEYIALKNSCSLEHNVLRNTMLPSLLQILKTNTHNEYPQKLFDCAKVFKKKSGIETNVDEEQHLGMVSAHTAADFTEMKQCVEYLFRMLNVPYTIEEPQEELGNKSEEINKKEQAHYSSFLPGRCAVVKVNGRVNIKNANTTMKTVIGYFGELQPFLLRNFCLEVPVVAFELDLTELLKMSGEFSSK